MSVAQNHSTETEPHSSPDEHLSANVFRNIENSNLVNNERPKQRKQKGRKRAKIRRFFCKSDKGQKPRIANTDFESPKPNNEETSNEDDDFNNDSLNGGNRCFGRRRDHLKKAVWEIFKGETKPLEKYTDPISRENALKNVETGSSNVNTVKCNFRVSENPLVTTDVFFTFQEKFAKFASEKQDYGSSPPLFNTQDTPNFSKRSSNGSSPFSHEQASGVSQATSMNTQEVEKPLQQVSNCPAKESMYTSSKITEKDKEYYKKINEFLAKEKLPFTFDQDMQFVKDTSVLVQPSKKIAFLSRASSPSHSRGDVEMDPLCKKISKRSFLNTVSSLQANMSVEFAHNKKFFLENDSLIKNCSFQNDSGDRKPKYVEDEVYTFKRFTGRKGLTKFQEDVLNGLFLEDSKKDDEERSTTVTSKNLKKSNFFESRVSKTNLEKLKESEHEDIMRCKIWSGAKKYMDRDKLVNTDEVSHISQDKTKEEDETSYHGTCTKNMERLKMEEIEEN